MKPRIFLLNALLFLGIAAMNAQSKPAALKMFGDARPWTADDIRRLADWIGVDYQKATFTSKDLKGKNYYVVYKDVWDGKITKTDTLIKSGTANYAPALDSEMFEVAVMGGKTGEKTLKAEFIFDRFSWIHEFPSVETDDYSLRIMDQQPIEIGKPFYAFAYIMPYEKDGYKYYCAVESSDTSIEEWGTKFGIKHYILFEMMFY